MSITHQEINFLAAIVDIVTIFGETECGCADIDFDAICEYLNSPRVIADLYGLKSKEQFYEYLTKDMLRGLPVWNFLKLSDWTRRMLYLSFNEDRDKLHEEMKKKYVCLRGCKYYRVTETAMGTVVKCMRPGNTVRGFHQPKKSCRYFAQ